MNFAHYFETSESFPIYLGLEKSNSVFGKIPSSASLKSIELNENSLVLFGVNESRNSNNSGAANAPDAIRQYLYGLSGHCIKGKLVDLGNLKATDSPSDTYLAVQDVTQYIIGKGATCIILGGTQEITWALYKATAEHNKYINLSIVDQTIDIGTNDGDFSSTCYIDKILGNSDQLFLLNIMGYQGYLTNNNALTALTKQRSCDLSRLGYIRGSMSEVEPTLRDSNIVSVDMGCIRQSDSPGAVYPSPNGLYAEEICQLARYSGLSNRVQAFGVFELNTLKDIQGQSSHLAAQIVWHFIDAFYSRPKRALLPFGSKAKRFFVKSPIPKIELVFVKDTNNDSWWMEMPQTKNFIDETIVIACSYNDYLMASKGDVPERWMRNWQRMT